MLCQAGYSFLPSPPLSCYSESARERRKAKPTGFLTQSVLYLGKQKAADTYNKVPIKGPKLHILECQSPPPAKTPNLKLPQEI